MNAERFPPDRQQVAQIAVDISKDGDRSVEVDYRFLPNGQIEILGMRSWRRDLDGEMVGDAGIEPATFPV